VKSTEQTLQKPQRAAVFGVARAAAYYRCPATLTDADDTAAGIVAWARSQQLTEVVGFAPA